MYEFLRKNNNNNKEPNANCQHNHSLKLHVYKLLMRSMQLSASVFKNKSNANKSCNNYHFWVTLAVLIQFLLCYWFMVYKQPSLRTKCYLVQYYKKQNVKTFRSKGQPITRGKQVYSEKKSSSQKEKKKR